MPARGSRRDLGYYDLPEILADPRHPERDERLDWLGIGSAAEYNPDEFDPHTVSKALSGRATVPIKQ